MAPSRMAPSGRSPQTDALTKGIQHLQAAIPRVLLDLWDWAGWLRGRSGRCRVKLSLKGIGDASQIATDRSNTSNAESSPFRLGQNQDLAGSSTPQGPAGRRMLLAHSQRCRELGAKALDVRREVATCVASKEQAEIFAAFRRGTDSARPRHAAGGNGPFTTPMSPSSSTFTPKGSDVLRSRSRMRRAMRPVAGFGRPKVAGVRDSSIG